ncbi:MAG: PAS domain S-box protein [Chloroflexi bacterium]|nr:PAS domain S-box protein [Chloroflexota bacterium]
MKKTFRRHGWQRLDLGGLLIVALYLLVGGLWILFSDTLAAILAGGDHEYLTQLSMYKGWGYVLVTSILLFLLIHANSRSLRTAHRKYLLLAENISDVVWVMDIETLRFTYVSPSIQQLRGLTPAEALRETPQQALLPESWERVARDLPARIEAFKAGLEKVYVDELAQLHQDGSSVWVEVTSRFVLNAKNGHVEVYAASRDITARRQTEQALRDSQSILNTAEEVAGVGSWRWNLSSQKVTWSDQMFRLFGVEQEGFDGDLSRVIAESIHPDDVAAVQEANRRVMEEARPTPMSYRILLPDGAERIVWAQGRLIADEQGRPVALTGYVQDITERVRAEKQLLQIKRLYVTLSQVNQTIVRVKSREELFQSICDVALYYGEYALAWIGLLDVTTGEVRPAASSGLEISDWPFPSINTRQSQDEGLVVTALRSLCVVSSENVQTDARLQFMHDQFATYGFRSSAAVPLQQGGSPVGILVLVSCEAGFFKAQDELQLLEEMGLDISFALDNLEREKVKRQWADAFEHCAHGIAIGLPDTNRILTCNPAFALMQGRPIEEIASMPILDMYAPEDHEHVGQSIAEADRVGRVQYEARMIRKNGSLYPVQMDVVSVRDADGKLLYRVATQQDISARKRAEQILRESETRFSKIFRASPIGINIFRLADGRSLDVNDSFLELVGYSREELIGRSAAELNLFVDLEARAVWMEQLRGGHSVRNQDARIRRKSGEIRDALASFDVININGEPMALVIAADITERKQAELKLEESEHFNQATIDGLATNLCVLDEYGNVLKVNRSWIDFAEANPPAPSNYCVGSNYLEVCDQAANAGLEEAALFAEGLRAVLRGERSQFNLEYACHEPCGESRWFNAHVTSFNADRRLRVAIAHENITERKTAEQNVRQSEETYRYLFANQPFAMWIYDLETLAFLEVNEAAIARYGYSRAEFLQMTLKDIRPPEELPLLMENLSKPRQVMEYSEGWHHLLKDGRLIEVAITSHVIQFGERAAVLVVAQDITERKQAENQVRIQLERISALNEIEHAISSSLDMRLSLDILLGEVRSQLGVDAASIQLFNPAAQSLDYVVGKGFRSPVIPQPRLRLGEGLAGQVGLERKLLRVSDLGEVQTRYKHTEALRKDEFKEYFGVPLIAKGTLKGVLEIFHRTPLNPDQNWVKYLETLGGQAAIAIDNVQLFEGLQQSNLELITAYDATIAGWSRAMDLRDKETEGHTQRVTDLTVRLSEQMGIRQQEQVHIRRGALLHDIGKLGVPDQILLKPGPLTAEEWVIMRQHPTYAFDMLMPIIYLRPAVDIPYCHHEKWDGSGYPRGLKEEQIPLAARLFAIVDVWDALCSDRPYRASWSREKTRDYILEQSGKYFDPRVVDIFLELVDHE